MTQLPSDTSASKAAADVQAWRIAAHASAFIQFLGIPSVVGPLVVWLIQRQNTEVEPHAREALNFQLSLLIYFIGGGFVAFVAAISIVGIFSAIMIGILLGVLFLLEIVFALIATLAASRGELYRYPMTLNLIKG